MKKQSPQKNTKRHKRKKSINITQKLIFNFEKYFFCFLLCSFVVQSINVSMFFDLANIRSINKLYCNTMWKNAVANKSFLCSNKYYKKIWERFLSFIYLFVFKAYKQISTTMLSL